MLISNKLSKLISILLVVAVEGGNYIIGSSLEDASSNHNHHHNHHHMSTNDSIASNNQTGLQIIENLELASSNSATQQLNSDTSGENDPAPQAIEAASTSPMDSGGNNKQQVISRRDQLSSSATTTSVEHQNPPNHQSYSNEMFASATYNLPVTSSLSSSSSASLFPQLSTPAPNNIKISNQTSMLNYQSQQQQQQLSSLLNRDHHQSRPYSDYIDSSISSFVNSYGNQVKDSLAENHNYNSQTTAGGSLNTGLIQNLTASLFPIQQLSNATLYTLSELLNKTRQQQQQQQVINGYRPNYNLASLASSYPLGSVASSSILDTATDTNQASYSSLLDYLRPNQFGFRDLTVRLSQQQSPQKAASSLFRPMSPLSPSYNIVDKSYVKNPSNIYNTYMPYKDNLNSPMPTMTNGQSLSMALYDNYLDNSSGYKYPLVVPASQQQTAKGKSASNINSQVSSILDQSNNFQYVQHHNSNNQNHLDKVVYHSTPFRPSIVSPPQGIVGSGAKHNSGLQMTSNNGVGSLLQSQQRPKSEADNKSMAFASLGSPSSTSINDSKPTYMTNGQAINASRYLKESASWPTKYSGTSNSAGPNMNSIDFDADHYHSAPLMANSTGDYDQEAKVGNSSNRTQSSSSPAPASSSSSSIGSAPGVLFDLYENEIDNQIRDALYQDAQQHALPLLGLAQAASNWLDKQPGTIYDDEAPLAARPNIGNLVSGLGSSQSNTYLTTSGQRAPIGAYGSASTVPSAATIDMLASTLQELPTFSASDLQPLIPTTSGPAYSLLSPALQSDTFTDSPLLAASLASHSLFSGNLKSTNSFDGANIRPTSASTSSQTSQQTNQQQPTMQASATSASSTTSGLPAILLKLQSGQLSSILTSPLAHLYANLPRYRYNKSKPSTASSSQASGTQAQHYPTKANNLWSLLANGGSLIGQSSGSDTIVSSSAATPASSIKDKYSRQQQQQQQQQAQLTAAAANLIAAASMAGQPMSPFQAALLQAQATNAYLTSGLPDVSASELSALYGSSSGGQASASASYGPSALDAGLSSASPFSYAAGLAGGGVSPLIWRGILTPAAHWARKQATGTSTSIGANNQLSSSNLTPLISSLLSPHQQGSHQNSSNSAGGLRSGLPLVSSLLLGGNHLFNSAQASSNVQQAAPVSLAPAPASASAATSAGSQLKPKIKIKILKIPVAVYDQPSMGGASQQALMPSQMQPSLTASILASMPCPLSHSGNLAQIPHQFDQHFVLASTVSPTGGLSNYPSPFSLLSPTTSTSTTNQLTSSSSSLSQGSQPVTITSTTLMNNERSQFDFKPSAIKGFTEFNHTDDLQVSPSNLHNKLVRLLS